MIVSALLTSLGINAGLCILFFTLYSILRKQPQNVRVYVPRLIAEQKTQQIESFDLERLLPSAGWVRRSWQPSEEELLAKSGLDAVVFMHIFIFSLRVFSVAGIVRICAPLPINYLGKQPSAADFSDLPNESLDAFSISNVKNGSKWLWIHFFAAYFITAVICFLLYYEYQNISSKRLSYFYPSSPQPHQFTVLVRGIPSSAGNSVSDSVRSFFTEYHSSTYLSHWVVHRTNKIQYLIKNAEKLYRKLSYLKSKSDSSQKFHRDGFLGLVGPKVNTVDHYQKKLKELQDNLRLEQSNVSLTGKSCCESSNYRLSSQSHSSTVSSYCSSDNEALIFH